MIRLASCLAVLAVLVSAVTGRADFVLTGTQHLDVTQSHDEGTLHDSSTADILSGGRVEKNISVEDNAHLQVFDGGYVWRVQANGDSEVDIFGGYFGYVDASQHGNVNFSGGTVGGYAMRTHLWSSAHVSGGYIRELNPSNLSTVRISGGHVGVLIPDNTSTVDISGGRVDYLRTGWYSTPSVTFHGYDFRALDGLSLQGERVVGTGTLTGKWLDGTSWTTEITKTSGSIRAVVAVPEPGTLVMLFGGAIGLLVCAWRRRRKGA